MSPSVHKAGDKYVEADLPVVHTNMSNLVKVNLDQLKDFNKLDVNKFGDQKVNTVLYDINIQNILYLEHF